MGGAYVGGQIQPAQLNVRHFVNSNLPSPIRAARQRPLCSTLGAQLRERVMASQMPEFVIEFATREV